jgi:ppGpp synthetase/RelA/SpoT-type nucleotidyltranferase
VADLDDILNAYDRDRASCEELVRRTVALVEDLLRGSIRVHSVTGRVKAKESLRRKAEAAEGKYKELSDITDIAGLRVITHFPDEVDAVAKIVEADFDVDNARSTDRRASLEPDRFGYLSLHYVCRHSVPRLSLPEWSAFKDQYFEIQIRSILQHSWAEIEHDLGYKSSAQIPAPVRRRFSRLAGLLEIADEEFAKIRDDLAEYESKVEGRIQRRPESVGIDRQSLIALVRRSKNVRTIDRSIGQLIQGRTESRINVRYLGRLADALHRAGFSTIQDVEDALQTNSKAILAFGAAWISEPDPSSLIPRGISLYYLILQGIARRSTHESRAILQAFGFSERDVSAVHARAVRVNKSRRGRPRAKVSGPRSEQGHA